MLTCDLFAVANLVVNDISWQQLTIIYSLCLCQTVPPTRLGCKVHKFYILYVSIRCSFKCYHFVVYIISLTMTDIMIMFVSMVFTFYRNAIEEHICWIIADDCSVRLCELSVKVSAHRLTRSRLAASEIFSTCFCELCTLHLTSWRQFKH